MEERRTHLLEQTIGLHELLLTLAREADNDIYTKERIGHEFPNLGNALTMMCVDENQQDTDEYITFAEFKTCGRMYMLKRRDYRLDVLLKANEKPKEQRQLTLESDIDDIYNYLEINPVTGEYMPKPLREYSPLHYRRLKDNG